MLKDRAAVHIASANNGQDVDIVYDPKYDSYIIDLRPKGPKHAKVTLNTLVVKKLIDVYNSVNHATTGASSEDEGKN